MGKWQIFQKKATNQKTRQRVVMCHCVTGCNTKKDIYCESSLRFVRHRYIAARKWPAAVHCNTTCPSSKSFIETLANQLCLKHEAWRLSWCFGPDLGYIIILYTIVPFLFILSSPAHSGKYSYSVYSEYSRSNKASYYRDRLSWVSKIKQRR